MVLLPCGCSVFCQLFHSWLAALHVSVCAGAITDHVHALLSRGQAAVEAIASGASDANSRKDADAFQQLQLIRQMMELAGQSQWDKLLQVRRL